MAWLSNWQNRIKVTVDNSLIDNDLINYPFAIWQKSDNVLNDERHSIPTEVKDNIENSNNVKKIAITTVDGTTQCYFYTSYADTDLDWWVIWIRASILYASQPTEFYFYYDVTKTDNPYGESSRNVFSAETDITAYYPLNERYSSVAYDLSVGQNDANRIGDNVIGVTGLGGLRDGTITMPISTGLPLYDNNGYAIDGWIAEDLGTGAGPIYKEWDSAGDSLFSISGTGKASPLRIYIKDNSGSVLLDKLSLNNTLASEAGQESWHHFAWIDDNGSTSLYIDGVLDGQNFDYTPATLNLNNARLSEGFSGSIDEFTLYNSAKSADWVKMDAYKFLSPREDISTLEIEWGTASTTTTTTPMLPEETVQIGSLMVSQEHHNLIPFAFEAENGRSIENMLSFTLDGGNNSYFDYSEIIKNGLQPSDNKNLTYVPKDETGQFEHKNAFHVEVFAKDASGVKDFNVRLQEDIYGYETPRHVFNAPKFSWSVPDGIILSLKDRDVNASGVWVGTTNNEICRIGYDSDSASVTYRNGVSSAPHTIVFKERSPRAYLTAYDHLMALDIDSYGAVSNVSSQIYEVTTISNESNDIAVLAEDDKVWTLQPYYGKILSRHPDLLTLQSEYEGFDAPYDMLWSEHHQLYFIVGTDILWTFDSGIKKAVYKIDGYEIADVDISPDGYICIVFRGDQQDIIRVLKPDIYGMAMNEVVEEGNARYCTYCDQGIFYVLVEKDIEFYGFKSYLLDSINGETEVIEDKALVATTTTTTTPEPPLKKVEIDYPNGGEVLKTDEIIEILWRSSESIDDTIKIELHKGGVLSRVIAKSSPNNGVYEWRIPDDIVDGIDYKIKIIWQGATLLAENVDESDGNFTIASLPLTTTTTTTSSAYGSIGISFNSDTRHIVNVLENGMLGFFNLAEKTFYGLFESALSGITCMTVRENTVKTFNEVSAVRMFVGSDEHLNDKWDSGVVETKGKSIYYSMYYGGGNNLEPGETYYVNIQVYDSNHGWSAVQTKEWTMPR